MEEKIARFDKQRMTESIGEPPLQEDDFTKVYESLMSPLSPPLSSSSLPRKRLLPQLQQPSHHQRPIDSLSTYGELERLERLEELEELKELEECEHRYEQIPPGLPRSTRSLESPRLPDLSESSPPELKVLPSAQQIKRSILENEIIPSPEKHKSLRLQDYNKILYTYVNK